MNQFSNSFRLVLKPFIFALLILIALFSQSVVFAAKLYDKATEFEGKFEPELVVDMQNLYGKAFKPVVDFAKYKFARPVQSDATVSVGEFHDPRIKDGKFDVLLIETKSAPQICADVDANGLIAENECVSLSADKNNANDFEGIIKLPIITDLFKTFPIFVRFKKDYKNPNLPLGNKLVEQSAYSFAAGKVDINGRKVLVEYDFKPISPTISATKGWFGIDIDGDGKIKNEPFSPESYYVKAEEAVFRFGDIYVSTANADLSKNKITLHVRNATEYKRQDLKVGTQMPDFAFVDFDDKKRSLSEFRGKYLLIDFWGLWCIDCRHELPYQLAAYKNFHSRNFEILGMNSDEKFEPVKEVLAKNGLTWTQAKLESIKTLIDVTYGIQEYPSALLLAPDGKVIVIEQKKLDGEELLKTLDKILPR